MAWHTEDRRLIDLHAHSTASDGTLSPTELLALAEQRELAAVALTDHDTAEGIAEARQAAAAYPHLRFAAGIEISATPPSGTLHIVGLGIDEHADSLRELMDTLQRGRSERNPKIVANLQSLGLQITMDDVGAVAREAGGTDDIISRVHIAEALRRNGQVKDKQDAFDRYLASGQPAYVDRVRFSPGDSIRAIHDAGGLAVLAHPPQLRCQNNAQLERIVRDLAERGLDGLEAYCSDASPEQTRHYMDLAKRFGLFVSGGSDYHGQPKPDVHLGKPRVPASLIDDALAERLFR